MSDKSDSEEEVDESEVEDQTAGDNKKLRFVLEVKRLPVLLEKSGLPSVISAKQKAIEKLKERMEQSTEESSTTAQLTKKIHNMKAEVKKKTDTTATGNKKVVLKEWEKEFLKLVKADSNPTFSRVPGGHSVGAKRTNDKTVAISQSSFNDDQLPNADSERANVPLPPKKKTKTAETILDKAETDETKKLTTTQLHRLVLLEQLKLLQMKQNRQHTIQIVQNVNDVQWPQLLNQDGPD